MSREEEMYDLLKNTQNDHALLNIAEKVLQNKRISFDDGVLLYEKATIGFAGTLANYIRKKLHGDITYFNRNFHIEPTNLCVFTCKFCSYSRLIKQQDEGWVMTKDDMLNIVRSYENKPVTEVHIVGGVLPQLKLDFFIDVLKEIKKIKPQLHIKGFTAVELDYMFRKAKVNIKEGLMNLKEAGLDSLPGGGAEIFDEEIREKICADKCNSAEWLLIHKTAHELGMHSNATMLYGHIENYIHRVDHMERLRKLQDETGGFNTFIPLKFRNKDNEMSYVPEGSVIEDLRNYAIARIYLDNFPHIKAYWPMISRNVAQLSLNFGVNDIDGTIDDSTKIYSMAGAEEQSPAMSTKEICELISAAGKHPVERDTLYNVVQDYKDYDFSNEPVSGFLNLPVIN
ncbi:MAG: aminofutalosine synthase MqnE [Fimbriimonadaceae bacterium]|nr:aminofutalosine synthase MqnE [Chitinophagales bacterium]